MLHRPTKNFPVPARLPSKPPALLVILWLVMQGLIYFQIGIVANGEASKYIYEANRLIHEGSLSSGNFIFYSVTIFLLALGMKLNIGYFLLLITQLAANFFATFSFYKLCCLYGSKTVATLLSVILLVHYPFQEFNFMLQTESLFFSLIIIYSFLLLSTTKWTLQKALALTVLGLALPFTRPSGILVIIPTILFFSFKYSVQWSRSVKIGLVITAFVLFGTGISIIMQSGGELNFLLPLVQEHIICGVPTNMLPAGAESGGPYDVIKFIANNPGSFGTLALKRSIAFFGLTRPYYSPLHNACLLVLFLPVFVLATFSLRNWWKNKRPEFIYLSTTILLTWMMVIFTCDDWHNRFIMALTPLFLLTAMPAIKLPASGRK